MCPRVMACPAMRAQTSPVTAPEMRIVMPTGAMPTVANPSLEQHLLEVHGHRISPDSHYREPKPTMETARHGQMPGGRTEDEVGMSSLPAALAWCWGCSVPGVT